MIAYDLRCGNNHIFEGWFEDETAYNDQQERKLISCPMCDDTEIFRIPSTFAIKSNTSSFQGKDRINEEVVYNKIVNFINDNFDNVGSDFTTEALKIHYGVSEPRNIRGKSTEMEEDLLQKEGVEFFKFPMPPQSGPESDKES